MSFYRFWITNLTYSRLPRKTWGLLFQRHSNRYPITLVLYLSVCRRILSYDQLVPVIHFPFLSIHLSIYLLSIGVNWSKLLLDNNYYRGIYILQEKIKRGSDRVDIDKLLPNMTALPDISGKISIYLSILQSSTIDYRSSASYIILYCTSCRCFLLWYWSRGRTTEFPMRKGTYQTTCWSHS